MGKKKKHQSKYSILEENARENNPISPTQQSTRNPTIKHQEPAFDNLRAELKGGLNSKKRKKRKEMKKKAASETDNEKDEPRREEEHIQYEVFVEKERAAEFDGISEATSTTQKAEQKSGVSNYSKKRKKKRKASKHGDDDDADNEKVEPVIEENYVQDEVIEETEHAAQVEGKDQFDSNSSPSKFEVVSAMPTAKSGNPISKSPWEEQKEESSFCVSSLTGSTRMFTEEDEIILLQGKIDCGSLHNVPASSVPTSVLHEFLDGKLHSDFNNNQINEKIRRLKKKFVKNMEMHESSGGKGAVFFNPHEATVFELAKNIWGGENLADNKPNGIENHVEDRIFVDDIGDIDVKAKKKSNNNVKRNLAGELGATEVAAADEDGKEDGEISMKKKRLLEGIEKVTKKIKLWLELAKLEYDELRKG